MIKSGDGRKHPSEAIPTGLTSPQSRGRSRRMKEPAELGPGHLWLVRGQYFPPGCQRPNSPFSNRKKLGDPHSSRIPRVIYTHTQAHTHTKSRDTHPEPFPYTKSWDTPLLATCPFPIAPKNLPMCYPIYGEASPGSISLPHPETPLRPVPSSISQDKSPPNLFPPKEPQGPPTCSLYILLECTPQSVLPLTIFSQIVPPPSDSRPSCSLSPPTLLCMISQVANACLLP